MQKIHFIADKTPGAQSALDLLHKQHPACGFDEANLIVVLGGDGLMLRVLHDCLGTNKQVYGMNLGHVGFLMNAYEMGDLQDKLEKADPVYLSALSMEVTTAPGEYSQYFAINEVSLFRESAQAAKIQITVDDHIQMPELICDGVLVATPAGSTAYNLSAHGPILPMDSRILALTPISPFRPRRWKGALLSHQAHISFDILELDKRPVSAVADFKQIKNIRQVRIQETTKKVCLLFDPDHNLEKRILREQFIE